MSDVTLILERANAGDDQAFRQLVPLVYDELRRRAALCMSGGRADHTLQPKVLVHEAFVKMAGGRTDWATSRHFFNAAAEVMRQILVDHARRKSAQKRGGGARARVDLEQAEVAVLEQGEELDWELLDGALSELERMDARRHRVVMLRYFAGLSDEQIAQCLEVSVPTVRRDWATAKVFLRAHLDRSGYEA